MKKSSIFLVLGAALIFSSSTSPVAAASAPLTPAVETQINTTTDLDQHQSSVTTLSDGGYVVVWSSKGSDGLGDIYTQRYTASGATSGTETRINTSAKGDALYPNVAPVSTGGYVVAWESTQTVSPLYSIKAQRFTAAGAKLNSEVSLGNNSTNPQTKPEVAVFSDGSYDVVWQSENILSDSGVHGQHVRADGSIQTGDFRVNTWRAGHQQVPAAISINGLEYVTVWQSPGNDGSGWTIAGQRAVTFGGKQGGEFIINTTTTGDQTDPSIALLAGGDYVVSWTSNKQDGSGDGVYVQRFNQTGTKVGAETLVNTTTTGDQNHSAITGLSDGGFVVSWDALALGGSGLDVYYQQFDATGAKVGIETLLNTNKTSDQDESSLTQWGSGFVSTWTSSGQDSSGNGVYGRTYATAVAPPPASTAPSLVLWATPGTLSSGGSTDISWSAIYSSSCTASGDWSGIQTLQGTKKMSSLTTNKTYSLSCTGPGGTISKTVLVTVTGVASTRQPSVVLTSSVTSVNPGGSAQLTWVGKNVSSCSAEGWTAITTSSGTKLVKNIQATKTYTINCTGVNGSATASVTVSVQPSTQTPPEDTLPPTPVETEDTTPTLTFTATPSTIGVSGSTVLTWSSSHVTSCKASGSWWESVSTSGTKSISGIPENKKYVLTCTGAQGTVSKSASVTVVSGLLGSSLISFSRDLFVGLSGDDVKSLQDTLLEKGHIIPSGATGYFGQETKAALVQFQTANGITPAEGYFGSKTKELLN